MKGRFMQKLSSVFIAIFIKLNTPFALSLSKRKRGLSFRTNGPLCILICVSVVLVSSVALQGMKDFENFNRGQFIDGIYNDDIPLVDDLFKCCRTEKEKIFAGSHFDDVKTVEMAQLFFYFLLDLKNVVPHQEVSGYKYSLH